MPVGQNSAWGGQPITQAADKTPAVPHRLGTRGGCPIVCSAPLPLLDWRQGEQVKEESGASQGDINLLAPHLLPRQSPHARVADVGPGHETQEWPLLPAVWPEGPDMRCRQR